MSYCREALRELSGDGPVMVAAETAPKQGTYRTGIRCRANEQRKRRLSGGTINEISQKLSKMIQKNNGENTIFCKNFHMKWNTKIVFVLSLQRILIMRHGESRIRAPDSIAWEIEIRQTWRME